MMNNAEIGKAMVIKLDPGSAGVSDPSKKV